MGGAGRRGEVTVKRDPDGEPYLSGVDDEYNLDLERPDLGPEEWFDFNSEELAIAYHVLTDQCQQYGWPLLDRCSFPDFVEFAYAHSTKKAHHHS
jgi:hypothetical protein